MDFDWSSLFAALPLLGHVMYGVPSKPSADRERHVTLFNGDNFCDSDEAPYPERISSVRAVSEAGTLPLQAEGSREAGVRVDVSSVTDTPAYLVVETPPIFIELAPRKFEGYLDHEGLTHVLEARQERGEAEVTGREIYSKHIKSALLGASGALEFSRIAVGLPVEIVPLDAKAGREFRVRILVHGVATASMPLRVSYRAEGAEKPEEDVVLRSDESGEAQICVNRPGLWRLHTIFMERHANATEADWRSEWASLTFRL